MKTLLFSAFFVFVAGSELLADSEKAIEPVRPANALFRLILVAYDGDPKKDKPERFTFQIKTIDLSRPSEFLRLGETIPHTKLKLDRFVHKTAPNAQTGQIQDVSELTIVNSETGKWVVLVLSKVTDASAASTPAQQTPK